MELLKRFKFPFYQQLDTMDCGPTCLRMIAKHYGKSYTLDYLRERSFYTREGVSILGISDAAEDIGFRTLSIKIDIDRLVDEVPLPAIAHWNQNHFVVVYHTTDTHLYVADPAHGLITYSKEEFLKSWGTNDKKEGVLLCIETTPDFFEKEDQKGQGRMSFGFLYNYLKGYKKHITQLFVGMAFGSLIGLILPFLTQSLVDFGINNQEINFVYTILIAQLMLFVGRTTVEFIRSWILLHMGTRINISIISDFLIKLMKLPMEYFDKKMTGDLLQRIQDHRRIETFLTSSSLQVVFSVFNMIVFGVVLAMYSTTILIVFAIGTAIHTAWLIIFMKRRRDLDYKRFNEMSTNQSNLIQLVTGMQEIKLYGCEKQKRWEWERIQAKLFKVSVKSLTLDQYQQAGGLFVTELKNIFISFIAANEVINGDMTLGMMMAVSYITGQLSNPIAQLLNFIHVAQDAKISLERLGEIHEKEDEDKVEDEKLNYLPDNAGITIDKLKFQYEGPHSEVILNNLNVTIPAGKITAIVGASGSGKTTILKMLLKYYNPVEGEIKVGDINLENFNSRFWRQKCGVVMQEGFVFNDTIAKNIAIGDEVVDRKKLIHAVEVANIKEYIEGLPLAYNTKIGNEGHGLSQGQKQRILIARAVYKDPDYLFFDEATSALDANNESIIMKNLDEFYKGKTVVVIAHRLSTVKSADQIIVLDKGEIIEQGNHEELTKLRGAYYNLVKNQLELGD